MTSFENGIKNPSKKNKPNTVFVGRFGLVVLHVGVCCAVVSVPCSLVVTCLERADLLAVMFVVFCHFPVCVLVCIGVRGEVGAVRLGFFTGRSKAVLLFWIICVFVSCLSHAFASIHCFLVVTCWGRAGLLALVGDVDCILLLSHVVSAVRCGTSLYQFLIFAVFLTFTRFSHI